MFSTTSAIKFVFAQFIVTSNVFTDSDEENHERCFAVLSPFWVRTEYHTIRTQNGLSSCDSENQRFVQFPLERLLIEAGWVGNILVTTLK